MEEKEKLGQGPAFANVAFDKDGTFTHLKEDGHYGMSKRFYAATKAMQGIQANSYWPKNNSNGLEKEIKECVRLSYLIADELLKQENE